MKNQSDPAQFLYKQIHEINQQFIEVWQESIVFTWQWWLGIILTILPWVVWLIYRKKDSTHRLLQSGFFIIILSFWLDAIGTQLGFWTYHYGVLPLVPSFIPWDISLLPVFTMFFIQVKPKFNPFIKALLFGLVISYLGEPLFVWIGLYETITWKHIYSLPIYSLLYLIAYKLTTSKSYALVRE